MAAGATPMSDQAVTRGHQRRRSRPSFAKARPLLQSEIFFGLCFRPRPHSHGRGRVRLLLRLAFAVLAPFFLSSSLGCVVPVAPSFEDPPASPNFPPVISDSDPHLGSIVPHGLALNVTVTDANVRDTLYVRWVSDYPLATADSRVLTDVKTVAPSPDGKQHFTVLSYQTDCAALAPGLTTHRIEVIVSDRPLKKPDDPSIDSSSFNLRFEAVDAGDRSLHVTTASWVLIGCS